MNASRNDNTHTVENKRVPRERELFDGEIVQILTDSSTKPHRDWLDHIITAKSKIKIQRALRHQNVIRSHQVWEASFRRELRELGEAEDLFIASSSFQEALEQDHLTFEEFLEKIATKKIHVRRFFKKYDLISQGKLDRRNWQLRFLNPFFSSSPPEFLVEDVNDPFLRFAQCCSPLPGDRVIGRLTEEQGLEIHRINCSEIKEEENLISVGWALPEDEQVQTRQVYLTALDKPGVLYQVAKVIKNMGVGILDIQSGRLGKDASINITLEPVLLKTYHKILVQLRSLKFVKKIV